MKNILAARNRGVIARFAKAKLLVAFDFDGTLASIVDAPAAAAVRPRTRALLFEVSRLYPCVVISGRSAADVARRLYGIPLGAIIGNHGFDRVAAGPAATAAAARTVRKWVLRLRRELGSVSGVAIENNGVSAAVHYRGAADGRRVRRKILATVEGFDARVVEGKKVVNLLLVTSPHKGIALGRTRRRLRCDTALYVGDDVTDEDAFTSDVSSRLLAIRVQPKADSAAPYFIRSQAAIDDLLEALIAARPHGLDSGRSAVPIS